MLATLLMLALADPAAVRCGSSSLADAVADYSARIRTMDTEGIAALYGTDGQSVLGGRPLVGRDAIARFLGGFKGFKVTASTMTITATAPIAAGWHTDGSFTQVGTTPDGTRYSTIGIFRTDWACDVSGRWRVRRMETLSDD
jgi:hypothetical protein